MDRNKLECLHDLAEAAKDRRAINTKKKPQYGHQGYKPAAWVFNLSASVIYHWINEGMYIYVKKNK